MKNRTLYLSIIITLIFNSVHTNAQDGRMAYNRGIELYQNGNYKKAALSFYKSYEKGIFPAYQALALSALSYSQLGQNDSTRKYLFMAEKEASGIFYYSKAILADVEYTPGNDFTLSGAALFDSLYSVFPQMGDSATIMDQMSPVYIPYTFSYFYYEEGIYDSSIYYSNIGLKYNEDPELLINIGDCYIALSEGDSALKYFSQAHDLDSLDPEAMAGIADAYLIKGQNREVLIWLEKALSLSPANGYTLYLKAYSQLELQKYTLALETTDELLKYHPEDPSTHFLRGDIYFELEEYPKAIKEYEKYLEYVPGDEDALYNIDAAGENIAIEFLNLMEEWDE